MLYAKTDEEITPNNNYRIDGCSISVKSLDLYKDFDGIRSQFDSIIDEWIGPESKVAISSRETVL